ncbi:MAG: hypothetical protein AAF517_02590, partial [Planctomycetota bacterium]
SVQFEVSLEDLLLGEEATLVVEAEDKLARSRKYRVRMRHAASDFPLRREVNWRGVTWVLVDESFYVSSTEITHGMLRSEVDEVDAIKLWPGGKVPQYERRGQRVSATDFPIVGVSPGEMARIAERVWQARFPKSEEWRKGVDPKNNEWWTADAKQRWINYPGLKEPSKILSLRVEGIPGCGSCKHAPVLSTEDQRRFQKETGSSLVHVLGNVQEIVTEGSGKETKYFAVGGHFNTRKIRPDEKIQRRKDQGDVNTGYRLLIHPSERAPSEFLRRIKGAQ